MYHFLFAVKAMFPTVCILFCGYGLKKKGVFSEEFLKQADKLCFSFLFPILVFWNLYHGRNSMGNYEQYGKVILFAYAVIIFSVMAGMVIVPRFVKERKCIPVVIQSLYRGNFMLYGLPFSEMLGGTECLVMATAMTAATLPLLNAVAIFQFAYYTGKTDQRKKTVFFNIIKNPIIWGVLLGLLLQWWDLYLPQVLEVTVSDLAKIATPLAFLVLGGRFHFRSVEKHKGLLSIILLFKLWIMPLVYLVFCVYVLKLGKTELIPIFIFVAAPTAITTYQLALQYDAEPELAGNVVVYSLLFSTVTMFVFICFLKYLGAI
ncbi:MAG: AEC family transporter [Anaerotignum sp.]|nr:AEC family transporter [Anaerotignum sp.]